MTSSPLQILIVTQHYPPHPGGVEVVAYQHAKQLVQAGHQVTVVTSALPQDITRVPQVPGVQLIRVPVWNPLERRFGVPFAFFSPRIVAVLYRTVRAADIVHIHEVFYMTSWIAAGWARIFRKTVVLMQHVDMIEHPTAVVRWAQRLVYTTMGRFIFATSTRILTLNDRVRAFVRSYGVPEEKLVDVVNGVDMDLFYPGKADKRAEVRERYGLRTDVPLVLFVGRFVPKKGFTVMKAARDAGYQIACVGGKTEQPSDAQVAFLGERTPQEIAELYRAADMFVLPSRSEGFPLVAQEAMASGLPVVMTADAGYRRYQFDAAGIYFLDTPTEAAVRTAIATLIADPDRCAAMAAYARDYAQRHFRWTQVGTMLEEVYRGARTTGVFATT